MKRQPQRQKKTIISKKKNANSLITLATHVAFEGALASLYRPLVEAGRYSL